jgi:hypothetical protein
MDTSVPDVSVSQGQGLIVGPLFISRVTAVVLSARPEGGDKNVIQRDSLQEGCSDSVVNTHPTESPKMAFWLHWRHCVHTTLGVPPWCT